MITAITGTVVHGDRRGRSLGFPTANLVLRSSAEAPAFGVYAGRVDGRPAAVSVGVRPTFGDELDIRLEAHILDFDGDLYGRHVTVELIEMLRDERRFASVDELTAQLHEGIAQVRALARGQACPGETPQQAAG